LRSGVCHLGNKSVLTLLSLGLALSLNSASAQGVNGARQAPYTQAQAATGAQVYETACAACHLSGLQGSSEAPELAGPNFRNQWGDRPVGDLLMYARRTMPPAAPGSISDEEYVAVVAYLMQSNGASQDEESLTFSTQGLALRAEGTLASAGDAPGAAGIRPAPGRLGTIPSPQGVARAPEVIGRLYETPTSRTETFVALEGFDPVSDAELLSPPPGDWLHWRGNPGSWGYSPLEQINTQNVRGLELAWVWQMEVDELRGWQGPLVRDGFLFLSNPGNVIQALDATDGTLLWEYRRQFPGDDGGINLRTLAIWEDLIFVATRDAHMVALDARTGVLRWETRLADSRQGYTNSTGPIVADGTVINGINGCQRYFEETCFITAHDARPTTPEPA